MDADSVTERLERIVCREFLLEPTLLEEVGLESLPERLAELMGCEAVDAVRLLVQSPLLEAVELAALKQMMIIRDMSLVSKTAAAISAELRPAEVTYNRCCQVALCHMIIGRKGNTQSALRAAAAKNDAFARHHFLYGLDHGVDGNHARAVFELNRALQEEPFEEGRNRISMALDILEP